VLINGVRGHTSALLNVNGSVGRGSAAVDLNTIPTLALSQVEVLRDGASAQYGSDAIAGVMNLRLREAAMAAARPFPMVSMTRSSTAPVRRVTSRRRHADRWRMAGLQAGQQRRLPDRHRRISGSRPDGPFGPRHAQTRPH
jgi:outer membrane receptor protein involved in Fe transport